MKTLAYAAILSVVLGGLFCKPSDQMAQDALLF